MNRAGDAGDLTEWAVERDGWTFMVGYLHSSDDTSDRATVEAMLRLGMGVRRVRSGSGRPAPCSASQTGA